MVRSVNERYPTEENSALSGQEEQKSDPEKKEPTPVRATGGAGFDFEDHISAWLMVKMLAGADIPGIGGQGIKIQAQVSALGWEIDDLLLTTATGGRLAISAKGNVQVSGSSLPSDFTERAWKMWRAPGSAMNRATDGLALVTFSRVAAFDEAWRDVKLACAHPDTLGLSRIRNNDRQNKIFSSVVSGAGAEDVPSDKETADLIRRMDVFPKDFQTAHSEDKDNSIAECRRLLVSGDLEEAKSLWQQLVEIAQAVRLGRGTVTLVDLWAQLRTKFALQHHPDYRRDWETLANITSDLRDRIQTELSSGFHVERAEEKAKLKTAISGSPITVLFGESGTGKSALLKTVLDSDFPDWTQVWFKSDDLKTALSAAKRSSLPINHDLAEVLNATTSSKNVLVIDSAERTEPSERIAVRKLLGSILSANADGNDWLWRVVFVTQPQTWPDGSEIVPGGRKASTVELGPLKAEDVKKGLSAASELAWLCSHPETISALTNLRALAWLVDARASLGSEASGYASHTAIADTLWNHWTGGHLVVETLMMKFARREAMFERTFPVGDLDIAEAQAFEDRPTALPLRVNVRKCIEFTHDLAADWARYQSLKSMAGDTPKWAVLAENPLWINALRMFGQWLLRQPAKQGTAWDSAFQEAGAQGLQSAGDMLLDAICLDPEAERFLGERVDLLLASDAKNLNRLLVRFHYIGTVPKIRSADTAMNLYLETRRRSVIIGRWPPILHFLIKHRDRIGDLLSPDLAKVIETWLTEAPITLTDGSPTPFRRELAEMALRMARAAQVVRAQPSYGSSEEGLYAAPLAAARDLPDEVGAWALELAGRRDVASEVKAKIDEGRNRRAKEHAERLANDPRYRQRYEKARSFPPDFQTRSRLPPWPLGPQLKVDHVFRDLCYKAGALNSLMSVRPEVTAEVLLALTLEDEPSRDGHSSIDIDLGLEYAHDGYPTAFWKSPFFPFLQVAPDEALGAVIALVNFCTERWVAEAGRRGISEAPKVDLRLHDGEERQYIGNRHVFTWPQTESNHNGNLFAALDAVEKWLTLKIAAEIDVKPYIERLLTECTSAAAIGLLVNVGKFSPGLFKGVLRPLLTLPEFYLWDADRVEQVQMNLDAWRTMASSMLVFELAKAWVTAPHRCKTMFDVAVELLQEDDEIATMLRTTVRQWTPPQDARDALEFHIRFAILDRDNYRPVPAPDGSGEALVYTLPEALEKEADGVNAQLAPKLRRAATPEFLWGLMDRRQSINDTAAASYFAQIGSEEGDPEEPSEALFRLAVASFLIVAGQSWLKANPEAEQKVLSIVAAAVDEIPDSGDAIRKTRIGVQSFDLKYAAFAAVHLWMQDEYASEWEPRVLRLMTAGNYRLFDLVVELAEFYRVQLAGSWWRLMQVGVFWSALILLAPRSGDPQGGGERWSRWLARLRRCKIRGVVADVDALRIERVARGEGRISYGRKMRAYLADENDWLSEPSKFEVGALDTRILKGLFAWLLEDSGTGNWADDAKLTSEIWAFEIARAKEHANDSGEYDLPSDVGYAAAHKLAMLTLSAPNGQARSVWEPVLCHGSLAQAAIRRFVGALFLGLRKGIAVQTFEVLMREIVGYVMAEKWGDRPRWYHGESLLCDLLGFGSEIALLELPAGAGGRLRDLYAHWSAEHLHRDEHTIARFSNFLMQDFGVDLRLEGLSWIAGALKRGSWYRSDTGHVLADLVNITLDRDSEALLKDAAARQAVVDIVASLAAKSVPEALPLQERIKQLR